MTYQHMQLPRDECIDGLTDRWTLDEGLALGRESHYHTDLKPWVEAYDKTRTYCQSILQAEGITDVDLGSRSAVITRAITTDMFSNVSANAYQLAADSIMNFALRDVRRLCKLTEQPDYKSSGYTLIEVEDLPDGGSIQGSNIETLLVKATGQPINVQDFVRMVVFSREILANEGVSVIPQTAVSIAQSVGLQIMRRLISVLETNGNLADGAALFAAAKGNLLTSGAASLASMEASMDALRSVTNFDGEKANVQAKYALCPSSKEGTFRTLVGAMNDGMAPEDRMEVISMANLSDSYFYVFGDPMQAPSIVMSTLAGADGSVFTAEVPPTPSFRRSSHDGVGVRVRAASGLAPVSRFVVRNTIS